MSQFYFTGVKKWINLSWEYLVTPDHQLNQTYQNNNWTKLTRSPVEPNAPVEANTPDHNLKQTHRLNKKNYHKLNQTRQITSWTKTHQITSWTEHNRSPLELKCIRSPDEPNMPDKQFVYIILGWLISYNWDTK